jgi:hypothetical protein
MVASWAPIRGVGKIVAETGGVRKVRRGLAGRANAAARGVIYSYPKNEKANLTMAQRSAMKRLVQILVAGYPGKK